jgi:hypothetical protein
MKKKISKRALIERIRRKLKKEATRFYKNRGGPYTKGLGKYYLIDKNNVITGLYIDDLESFARGIGVIRDYEALAKD